MVNLEHGWRLVYEIESPPLLGAGLLVLLAFVGAVVWWRRAPTLVGDTSTGRIVPVVAVAVAAAALLLYVGRWQILADKAARGECETVRGVVSGYTPAPGSSHGREIFRVGSERFVSGAKDLSPGYKPDDAPPGSIRDGVEVRICHVGHRILSLAVRQD